MKCISYFSILLALAFVTAMTSCGDKGKGGKTVGTVTQADNFKVEPGQSTPLQFSHLKMDFKPVTAGDTVKAVYPFKNMTNTPIIISQIATSCACMMTDYPKGNIQPGQIGEVKVNFATAGQFGDHYKLISVLLQGSNEPITLQLNGRINKAE